MIAIENIMLKFDWKNLLLGESDWQFLLMIAMRTFAMFLVILIGLRMLGKRGISQLSVFELGVVVGLGSAAGDPMFYKDVGILSCILVFAIVIGLYHVLKFVVGKNDWIDEWVEGVPKDIVHEGKLVLKTIENETITKPELFAQLRVNSVSHLGQLKQVILEPTGQLSVYYFQDKEVKYGLPILPQLLNDAVEDITATDHYSCTYCGHTMMLEPTKKEHCPVCNHCCWVKSINETRLI
ncbi:DUF421 domain-containing protein [Ilyomonas limi]|uniref:DUF421 domain-containing protein n=1 Tax=Ilyomonas limi TaxID=2575867 RepID=A0A4U3L3X2_9BACT|nr:YetF domain-containing protein [Ilyomonas limi]TKK69009.1 DUF421 domain-containing protein [Ilyomonas limi]